MTKKKILVLALTLAMVAILAVGGSLAYFTSEDKAENTFTAGGVEIDLIEQQVNKAGDDLEDFKQGQTLFPIVGSAQGEKDDFGQPIAENYVDKIVTIKNTGKSAAWVRAYFAIPSDLDDGYESFNASANILHFNFGNKDGVSTIGKQWIWNDGTTTAWNYYETTIEGVHYNVYYADYYQPLAAGATTEQFISGVYLDENVDMKNGEYTDKRHPNADLSILKGIVKCPVATVAVQANGFDNAVDAINKAFGVHYNPFGGTAENWKDGK